MFQLMDTTSRCLGKTSHLYRLPQSISASYEHRFVVERSPLLYVSFAIWMAIKQSTFSTTLRHDFRFTDPFQGCEQVPAGVLESPKDKHKRAEEAEEVEVGEAEGPLTQRRLAARQLFISLLLKLSYCVTSRIYRHLYKPTMGRRILCSIFV